MTTNLVRLDNLFNNKYKPILAKATLPEKVFSMSLMSLCHKPFVYKGWVSDIKWHYRPKSDIKLQRTPIFGVFFAIMLFTPYIYFTLIEFYPTLRLTVLNRMDSSKKLHINNKYDRINLKVWKYRVVDSGGHLFYHHRLTACEIVN